MEGISFNPQGTKLLLRYLSAGGITTAIELSLDDEPTAIRRVADEVHDHLVRAQRTTAPVHRDERKHAVLDLVPLARSRRKVADVDREVELVGEPLQFGLPQAGPVAVASAGIGGDEDLARIRIARRSDPAPPRFDRRPGDYGGVVVRA